MYYQKTVTRKGITVLTERMEAVRSVALGFWFATGSRHEPDRLAGMSHFLEHMMFKGTPNRTAADISQSFDRIGAELNAFTSKECTCYYARFVDQHLQDAVEVLADMVSNASLDEEAIRSEREVVLEEISRHEDTPDDRIHELFSRTLWTTHPLGRPILGHTDTVSTFNQERSLAFKDERYGTGDLVIAASGNVDHDDLVTLVERYVSLTERPPHPRPDEPPNVTSSSNVITRDTEQAHICYGFEAIPADDDDRFALSVMDSILGGGMSSRLFQEIREKHGLAYSVYSYRGLYRDTGALTVYVGTRPSNAVQVMGMVKDEIEKLLTDGINDEELHRAKESIKGHLVLGLENTSARMTRLGKAAVTHGQLLSVDELIDRIDSVDHDAADAIARRILTRPANLAMIGPFQASEVEDLL